jgi:hypothetical protein
VGKISGLTAVSAGALANEFEVNEAGASKKITLQQIHDSIDLLGNAAALADADKLAVVQSGAAKDAALSALVTYLQTKGMPRVKQLTAVHSTSVIAPTKVTDLDIVLEPGTYTFDYYLIERSATITVGPQYNINFSTGTVTKKNWWFQYADLSSTLLAAIGTAAHDTSTADLGFQMAKAEDDFATTAAGNMGPTAAPVQTVATDIMVKITGILVVTVQGTLELWHGSETATATSVEAGSSLVVNRTA